MDVVKELIKIECAEINKKISSYYKERLIIVWYRSLEQLFVRNEDGLKSLFKKFADQHKFDEQMQTGYHLHESHTTIMDIKKLVQRTDLKVTNEQIIEAFALSKTTQVFESDKVSLQALTRANYAEFLEIICRITTAYFQGSEMEDMPLDQKLAITLKPILRTVSVSYVDLVDDFVEMFSESDGSQTECEN